MPLDARAVDRGDRAERASAMALDAAFACVGVGALLPWNALVTEAPYFARRFASSRHALVRDSFEGVFAFAYSLSNALGVAACAKTGAAARMGNRARLGGATLACAAATWTCAAGTRMRTMSADWAFAHVMVVVLVCGGCSALAQAGGFAAASELPPRYARAVMSGQAASGVAASLAAMITTAGAGTSSLSSERQAEAYFYVAAGVLLVCAWATTTLDANPTYARLVSEAREARAREGQRLETSALLGCDDDDIDANLMEDVEDGDRVREASEGNVVDECRDYRSTVIVTFVATLCVFPAITSAIESSSGAFGALWSPTLFLLFNVGDLIGRHLASIHPKTPPSGRLLLRAALLRFAFIPFLAACNVSTEDWRVPKLFKPDIFPIFFISALAVTNGWIASVAMMYGPGRVPPSKRQAEGVLLTFCLVGGIFAGTATSLVLTLML